MGKETRAECFNPFLIRVQYFICYFLNESEMRAFMVAVPLLWRLDLLNMFCFDCVVGTNDNNCILSSFESKITL